MNALFHTVLHEKRYLQLLSDKSKRAACSNATLLGGERGIRLTAIACNRVQLVNCPAIHEGGKGFALQRLLARYAEHICKSCSPNRVQLGN